MTPPSPDILELLSQMIRFPSLSGEEKAIADFVEGLQRKNRIRCQRIDDNVVLTLGHGDHRLLLNSHLDVVPPSEGHPFAPFDPVVRKDRLYGRGSVDAKASGAAMLCALLSLDDEGWIPPDGEVMVALTACEETGGGYNGMEAIRPYLPPLAAALVGEPTHLQPCVAQKGLLILTLEAYGRSAHAARAHLGDNAIERAARDITRLSTIEFDREDPFLGRPTASVTVIEGGKARNVVPDLCRFTLDVRSTPAYTHDELRNLIGDLVESTVHVHSARIVPVATRLEEDIVQACLAANTDAIPFGSPTASDWIFLSDIPVVKIGPGDSQLSHTADESIRVAELYQAVDTYRRIIKTYFERSQA
jgi:acetylornithine deacetylase